MVMTWTTLELAPPPNYHTTPTGGRFSSTDLTHRRPTRRVFSGTGIELVTSQATILYLYHWLPRPPLTRERWSGASVISIEGS
ncbi:hypothetical protein TNCV_3923181 [Trichonephila clavipes]|nr:hypothetical protein TNCV_3923181 [Trichonephila clavipes]